MGVDRYRDAVIACGAMVHLLKDTGFRYDSADAARLHAEALRMMDRFSEAIEMSRAALELGEGHFTDETKALVLVNLALALKKAGKKEEAIATANTVRELVNRESSSSHQAESIIAELTLIKGQRLERLVELEASARHRGHDVVANNIAIDLARDGADPDDPESCSIV